MTARTDAAINYSRNLFNVNASRVHMENAFLAGWDARQGEIDKLKAQLNMGVDERMRDLIDEVEATLEQVKEANVRATKAAATAQRAADAAVQASLPTVVAAHRLPRKWWWES